MPIAKTIAMYPVDEILEKVGYDAVFEGIVGDTSYVVKVSSLRLRTFQKSRTCVCCGRVGTVMGLDFPDGQDRPHFNLYCIEDGEMILMTKDHIIPKSKGGKNHISNMQTMCCHCNLRKGDKSPEEYRVFLQSRKLIGI